MAWPQTWLWVPGATLLYLLLPLYFPNGRLLSPRWRWFSRFIIAAAVAMAIVAAVIPGETAIQVRGDEGAIVNPLGLGRLRSVIPASPARLLDATIPALVFGLFCGATTSLLLRFHRAKGVERQQLKWLTYALTTFVLLIAVNSLFRIATPFGGLYLVCIPVAVGIAILRHNLYDIDLLINRTLVYGALTASVIGIYVFAVGYLGSAFRRGADLAPESGRHFVISLVATGVVAVLFQPLREQLQRAVNRLMYGERDEP
ncbi:MAG TPA: hypothetical protein VLA19_27265 [Herpetosiphonaceae bacterium]|nr:hypothetical protein [Herpetosiphonaceae bacterium]